MDYKLVLGGLAVVIGLYGYLSYFRGIFSGKTKPHAFSWLVWAVLTGIVFVAQVVKGGGAGSWITGITSLFCFAIFVLALFKGRRDFPRFDWLCLIGAGVSLLLWWLTHDPTATIILIILTDAIAFAPTYRKGYYKPYEETVTQYVMASLKSAFSLFALQSYSLATWLFPLYLVVANGLFVVLLSVRRRVFHKKKS